jgi:hypothetical protein
MELLRTATSHTAYGFGSKKSRALNEADPARSPTRARAVNSGSASSDRAIATTARRQLARARRRRNPGVQTAVRESSRFKPVPKPAHAEGRSTPFHFPRTRSVFEMDAGSGALRRDAGGGSDALERLYGAKKRREGLGRATREEMLLNSDYGPGYALRRRKGTLRPGTRYMGATYLDKDKPPEVLAQEASALDLAPPTLFDAATRRSHVSSSWRKDKKNSYLPPSEWTDDVRGHSKEDYFERRNDELVKVWRLPDRPWVEPPKGRAYGLYVPPKEIDPHEVHREKMKDPGYRIQMELKADNAALRESAKVHAHSMRKWSVRFDRWKQKHDVHRYYEKDLKRPGTATRKVLERLKNPLKRGFY